LSINAASKSYHRHWSLGDTPPSGVLLRPQPSFPQVLTPP
jgi:hypothetical protein